MNKVVVECTQVKKTYQQDAVPVYALRGVDIQIEQGDFASLSGPSGSGKSTLLNMIGGLDRPDEGDVIVDGISLSGLSESELAHLRLHKIGFVFQAYNLIPVLSAQENVEFILQLQGVAALQRRQRAQQALESLGLADMSHRRPGELSGGQQQRVAIARAIVTNPALLLADEPTANIDPANQQVIIDLIRDTCREENIALLMVTHSQTVAEQFDRVEDLSQFNHQSAHAG